MVASRTDLYLSTVANRQGEISKQLTVIASIFLPLSFLTGFFGMNFEWEGGHLLSGVWTFVALGLGSMAVATAAMWWWFRHNGWTRSDEQFGPHIANIMARASWHSLAGTSPPLPSLDGPPWCVLRTSAGWTAQERPSRSMPSHMA